MERFPRNAIVILGSSVLRTMVAVDCYMVEVAVVAFMDWILEEPAFVLTSKVSIFL